MKNCLFKDGVFHACVWFCKSSPNKCHEKLSCGWRILFCNCYMQFISPQMPRKVFVRMAHTVLQLLYAIYLPKCHEKSCGWRIRNVLLNVSLLDERLITNRAESFDWISIKTYLFPSFFAFFICIVNM